MLSALQIIAREIVHSRGFHVATTVAILACAVVLGLETYSPGSKIGIFFLVVDWVITFYFLVEIVLRLLASSSLLSFFKCYELRVSSVTQRREISFLEDGLWNCFDTIIVLVSTASLFGQYFEHPELLAVMRLLRVFRILRLLEVSQELKAVEMKILSIIPTIFSFALLLGVLIYIYAIIGVYMFQYQTFEAADFSNVQSAAVTLFQCMTLEGWANIMYQAVAKNQEFNPWFVRGYFVSFVVLTVIVSLNVFVAVLTSQVQEKIAQEQKREEMELEAFIRAHNAIVQEKLTALTEQVQQLRAELERLMLNRTFEAR